MSEFATTPDTQNLPATEDAAAPVVVAGPVEVAPEVVADAAPAVTTDAAPTVTADAAPAVTPVETAAETPVVTPSVDTINDLVSILEGVNITNEGDVPIITSSGPKPVAMEAKSHLNSGME